MPVVCSPDLSAARPELPTRTHVQLGDRDLDVLVARTPAQWRQGMVGQLTDVDGMLFEFGRDVHFPFHMPAEIDYAILVAFFDETGHAVDVGFMQPRPGRTVPAVQYRRALELIGPHAADPFSVLSDITGGLRVGSTAA